MIKFILLVLLSLSVSSANCFDNDRPSTILLFDKAFETINIKLNNLYWVGKEVKMNNGGYSTNVTFDGKLKRGLIWFDKNCKPNFLKISNGYGKVTMYYFSVNDKNIKLIKTRENTYKK